MSAVRRAITLPVDRERAWRAVTEELDAWLADEVDLDPREGGAVTVRWNDGRERTGVVEDVAEERRLSFRWSEDGSEESLVELTLDEVEDGTRVTVLEAPVRALVDGTAELAPVSGAWGPQMTALAGSVSRTSRSGPYASQSGTFVVRVGAIA
jgi:uncharacterized protein YndB with AHSA1/START domain